VRVVLDQLGAGPALQHLVDAVDVARHAGVVDGDDDAHGLVQPVMAMEFDVEPLRSTR